MKKQSAINKALIIETKGDIHYDNGCNGVQQMKKLKQYKLTPAHGQALLNFRGRRLPESMDVYETMTVETVTAKRPNEDLPMARAAAPADGANLLLQGDCLSACAHLKDRGVYVDLIYIDPPFASGANYAKQIWLRTDGKQEIETDAAIGEEIMYGDIWQKEDYLNWLYERLLAMREILKETGSIYVHLDSTIGHYAKVLMDEVFGEENFQNEIVWNYQGTTNSPNRFAKKHDCIYFYSKSADYFFNADAVRIPYGKGSRFSQDSEGRIYKKWSKDKDYYPKQVLENGQYRVLGKYQYDVWNDIPSMSTAHGNQVLGYATQKPDALLKRIITASSEKGMIVADFFCGSGTAATIAHGLERRFIACDVGLNAVQTTRDRLKEAGAGFDVLQIQDGLRLTFRNPEQTTRKLFGLIAGFSPRENLELAKFWDGCIAGNDGSHTLVKFSGIHQILDKRTLDIFLEEVYQLEDIDSNAYEILIIHAHKDLDVDQQHVDRQVKEAGKTRMRVKLRSLESLLEEHQDVLFTPDSADIQVRKKGSKHEVRICRFYSPYLKKKVDSHNARKIHRERQKQGAGKRVMISENGLELIEAVQFDTTLGDAWQSNPKLEDKASPRERVKGTYLLDTHRFRMKIRNIAGDETVIESGLEHS
ncbi:MAG: DNA methyltransferase [Candidatus Eutrophobiaceae bacterium]